MTPGLAVSSQGPRVTLELVALTHGILRACLIPAADTAEDGVGYTLEASATEVLVGYEDPRDRLCALIGLAHVCTALEELLVQGAGPGRLGHEGRPADPPVPRRHRARERRELARCALPQRSLDDPADRGHVVIDKALTRPVLKAMLLAVLGAGVAGCTDITLPEPAPAQSVASGELSGRVVRVADGDTLTVLSGAREEKVRLLGIDTPELAHGANPAECGGAEARAALTLAVMGHRVQVVPDERADSRDRFGRLLGYVETAAGDAGLALIEQGLASAWRPKSAPTPTRWETYRSAQRKAQAERVGNWAACGSVGRLQR